MNKLTFCPECGQRGLERVFGDGTVVFLHGKDGKWSRTCSIVDRDGKGNYCKIHEGRWVKIKIDTCG